MDGKWEANYKGAKAVGIPIGTYYFVGKGCATTAGYDYSAVQAKANTLVKKREPTPVYYTVKSGDTLSAFAKMHGTSVSTIRKANPALTKNVNLILTGWKIRVK